MRSDGFPAVQVQKILLFFSSPLFSPIHLFRYDDMTIFNVWELSKRASNCLGETRAGRKKEPTMMVGVESSRR